MVFPLGAVTISFDTLLLNLRGKYITHGNLSSALRLTLRIGKLTLNNQRTLVKGLTHAASCSV